MCKALQSPSLRKKRKQLTPKKNKEVKVHYFYRKNSVNIYGITFFFNNVGNII